MKPEVTIYTDGAANPNPGPGGYGVVLLFGPHRRELSAGYARTTNNRMELLGVIEGLNALKKPCQVVVYSDSKYVVDAVQKGWVAKWAARGWVTAGRYRVKNIDLWKRLIQAAAPHDLELRWVPGHRGIKENERCDFLAGMASRSAELLADAGYLEEERLLEEEGGERKKVPVKEGDPCRKCGEPLVRRVPRSRKKRKPGRTYYYEWYLHCAGCRSMLMVEEAKRLYADDDAAAGGPGFLFGS